MYEKGSLGSLFLFGVSSMARSALISTESLLSARQGEWLAERQGCPARSGT